MESVFNQHLNQWIYVTPFLAGLLSLTVYFFLPISMKNCPVQLIPGASYVAFHLFLTAGVLLVTTQGLAYWWGDGFLQPLGVLVVCLLGVLFLALMKVCRHFFIGN